MRLLLPLTLATLVLTSGRAQAAGFCPDTAAREAVYLTAANLGRAGLEQAVIKLVGVNHLASIGHREDRYAVRVETGVAGPFEFEIQTRDGIVGGCRVVDREAIRMQPVEGPSFGVIALNICAYEAAVGAFDRLVGSLTMRELMAFDLKVVAVTHRANLSNVTYVYRAEYATSGIPWVADVTVVAEPTRCNIAEVRVL